MIQICGESIIILFKIIFEPSFCEAEFHNTLKKGNKATVYKKEKKNLSMDPLSFSWSLLLGQVSF